jgi:uncharacterized protein YndB with AHSA1/START domain
MEQLTLVLGELGIVTAVQRAPDAPVGALKPFGIGTAQDLNEMVESGTMIEVTAERVVAAAPEAVWRMVSDPDELPRWFGFAERVEVLEGEGVGQKRRQHGHWGKKPSEVDQELTAYEPGRRLAWRHLAERLDGKPAPRFAASTDFTIELSPEPRGTRVRLRSAQEPASKPRGLVMKAFGRRELQGTLTSSLDALERVLR